MPFRKRSKQKYLRLEHERVYNPYELKQGETQHAYVVVEDAKGRQEFLEIERPELLRIAAHALKIHADMADETVKYARWRREA